MHTGTNVEKGSSGEAEDQGRPTEQNTAPLLQRTQIGQACRHRGMGVEGGAGRHMPTGSGLCWGSDWSSISFYLPDLFHFQKVGGLY